MADQGVPVPSTFHFADVWEAIWPRVAEAEALVCGDQRRTYGELGERVNQLARLLLGHGVGVGDHVGICMPNRVEWLEVFLASFTIRAVPVNLNHRYTASELRPLLAQDGATAIVFDTTTAEVVGAVADELGLPVRLQVGSALDEALAGLEADPVAVPGRSGDDPYVIYTGGTTGMPKGVVWRQEDAFFACIGGGDPMRTAGPVTDPAQLVDRLGGISYLPVAPLMHAAAQWTTLSWLFCGGKTTLMPGSLDPEAVWQAVQDEAVNVITVVGDAVGGPILDCWDANPGRWDASSLFVISNGGAPMSPTLKARIGATFPDKILADGFGSSETGVQGSQRLQAAEAEAAGGMTRFQAYENTLVLDDDRSPVAPGSGVVGRVALSGRIPWGYHADPDKTAETFVDIDGVRYVITGDMATVEADGTIQLLGRGSQCINTGGEKVFPEEVEAALVGHPAVADVLVVGVPDPRWGSAVTAVVAPKPHAAVDLDELREHCRATLAGYKLPKNLVVVDAVRRSPAGKADYRWAEQVARSGD